MARDNFLLQVLEETGCDVSKLLKMDDYIEVVIGKQRQQLYIVTGVKEDTAFAPLTKKEISDLKNLKKQLYSAAEYFELSYINDDQKQIVVNTLKDYTLQALVNTIDHLGSMTYKVNGLLDENFDEVSGTQLRASCIQQTLRACQSYIDREGLSQQSLVITTPKYHKRYILPVKSLSGSGHAISHEDEDDWHVLRTAIRSTIRGTPSFVKKSRSQSPSSRFGTFAFTEKRSVSPLPTVRLLSRSGSTASRPTTPNSSNARGRSSSVPQKSASMRFHSEKDGHREIEPNPSKSKRLLKALLSRRKSKDDPALYSYLDEY